MRPIDVGLLAAAAAADAIGDGEDPARSIEAAVGALYDAVAGVMPSVFVLEHGPLRLVAQRGYAVVPAVRLGRSQLAAPSRLRAAGGLAQAVAAAHEVGAAPAVSG